jgi:membrane-anchored protein YejM (alkaline phosphatase superfamily)
VLITSSQGNLNREEQETTYSMAKGHVPLIVLWPRNTLRGVKFTTVSSHFDIASTVGEEILGIKTPSSKYSIGNSLLKLADRDYFVTNMGASLLLISNNAVTVYRKNGRAYIEKDGEKTVIHPNLETLIQAMSELNRFKG